MNSLLLILYIWLKGTEGACIKLIGFDTTKGDLEGAYLNGMEGVGDSNLILPDNIPEKLL